MTYFDTPLAEDPINSTQPLIRANFLNANSSYGVDHYEFNDLSMENGMHRITHWPPESSPPVSSMDYAQIYAYQPTLLLPILHHTLPGLDEKITNPITFLQSGASEFNFTTGSTINIQDFTGFSFVALKITFYNGLNSGNSMVCNAYTAVYNGSWHFKGEYGTEQPQATSSGATLQLRNTSGSNFANAFWTVEIFRYVKS